LLNESIETTHLTALEFKVTVFSQTHSPIRRSFPGRLLDHEKERARGHVGNGLKGRGISRVAEAAKHFISFSTGDAFQGHLEAGWTQRGVFVNNETGSRKPETDGCFSQKSVGKRV